jgi:tol-pal system protein YbgF
MALRFDRRLTVLGALFAALLSACVSPQQIELLERENRRLRGDLTTLQSDVDVARTSLADTRANMQQMQRDLSAIKEGIDETRVQMGRQIGQSSREGDQRVKSLESRLARLEEEAKKQAEMLKNREEELKKEREAAQAAALLRQTTPDGNAEVVAAENETIRRDYENAWRLVERKEYRPAIARFKEFIKKHGKSKLSGNAQYWIGDSHFNLNEFDRAIVEFDEVRRRYPQSERVPLALLGQGNAFGELGEKLNARLVLQELVEKFPQSPEAQRAKQKLKSLES